MSRPLSGTEIAIVGMAGRFPGARDVEELWRNLRGGVEAVRFPDAEEFAARGLDPVRLADPNWVKAVSQMDGYDCFDELFFGINPRTFVNLSLVDPGDVTVGIAKCLAYGAAIPVVSVHAGLTTFGGSAGVGAATTRAVVNSSLAVIALDFLISGAGYLAFP